MFFSMLLENTIPENGHTYSIFQKYSIRKKFRTLVWMMKETMQSNKNSSITINYYIKFFLQTLVQQKYNFAYFI